VSKSARTSRSSAPQERALLERVLDGAPIGIIVLDRDLRFLRVNTRAAAMFGIDEQGSAGLGFADVLPVLAAQFEDILRDVLIGGSSHVAIETSTPRLKSDTPGVYLAYYYPLRGEDESVIGVGCMFTEITEQRAAEVALRVSEAARRQVVGEMLHAEEGERSRLALALHDDTIQVLCALLVLLDQVIPLAKRSAQSDIAERLLRARQVLADTTDRTRKLMFELHPNVLEERGLRTAVMALATQAGDEIGAQWSVDMPDRRYSWTVEELAYRIIREALTNVRKHSGAGRFEVVLEERADTLAGFVQDDGRGLGRGTVSARGGPIRVGLEGMRERARMAGGDVTFSSERTGGARVDFAFPVDERTRGWHTRDPR
jgi:signal transduction histidine kinase